MRELQEQPSGRLSQGVEADRRTQHRDTEDPQKPGRERIGTSDLRDGRRAQIHPRYHPHPRPVPSQGASTLGSEARFQIQGSDRDQGASSRIATDPRLPDHERTRNIHRVQGGEQHPPQDPAGTDGFGRSGIPLPGQPEGQTPEDMPSEAPMRNRIASSIRSPSCLTGVVFL